MTNQQRLSRWEWTLLSWHQEAHFQLLSQQKHIKYSKSGNAFNTPCVCLILTVIKLRLTYQIIPSCQLPEVPWSPPADLGPPASCSAADPNPYPRGLPGCPGSRPPRCRRGSWALALPSDGSTAPSGCTHISNLLLDFNIENLSHQ